MTGDPLDDEPDLPEPWPAPPAFATGGLVTGDRPLWLREGDCVIPLRTFLPPLLDPEEDA